MTIAEALELATGRQLLHGRGSAPVRVWMINLEDPRTELVRRVAAACKHYDIQAEDIRHTLAIDSGLDFPSPFITAITTRDQTTIAEPVYDALAKHLREQDIKVLYVDPFVSSHRVTENDNGAIDMVVKRWSRLAHDTQTCIVLVHHTRKTGEREAVAEDSRGGIAIVGAVRLCRVLNVMTEDEFERSGEPADRWRYFRTTDGKANLTPRSDKSTWFRLASVTLPNGPAGTPGDSVGVVTPWHWPDPFEDVTTDHLNRVMSAVSAPGAKWKAKSNSKEWVGHLVADVCGIDLSDASGKAQVKQLIATWIGNGALVCQQRRDAGGNYPIFVTAGSSTGQ